MQPIISPNVAHTAAQAQMPQIVSALGNSTRASRRNTTARNVSYIDQGSSAEDEPDDYDGGPDAGEKVDSDDEDFVASGGVRTSVRQGQRNAGHRQNGTPRGTHTPMMMEEATQSYLGQEPPERLLKWRRVPKEGNGHGARELHGEVNIGYAFVSILCDEYRL